MANEFLLSTRNNLFAIALLLASVQLLDFLSFHHLFGPWAVIIGKLMVDLGRFLVILLIFVFGFSMYVAAIYNPLRPIYSDFNYTINTDRTGYPPAGESSVAFLFRHHCSTLSSSSASSTAAYYLPH